VTVKHTKYTSARDIGTVVAFSSGKYRLILDICAQDDKRYFCQMRENNDIN